MPLAHEACKRAFYLTQQFNNQNQDMEQISQTSQTKVSQQDRESHQDNEIKRVCSDDTNSIKVLNLANNTAIVSLTLKYFSGTKWSNLTVLNLYFNNIEGKGCKYITNASMESLTVLDIGFNKIGSLGVFHLSKGQWNRLENVYLSSNKIKFEGIFWFSKSQWGNNLQKLSMFRNEMPEEQFKLILLAELKQIQWFKFDENLKVLKDKMRVRQKIRLKYGQKEVLV